MQAGALRFGQVAWPGDPVRLATKISAPDSCIVISNSTLRWSAFAIRRLNRMEQSIARQNLETRLVAANNFFVHAFVIRPTLFLL